MKTLVCRALIFAIAFAFFPTHYAQGQTESLVSVLSVDAADASRNLLHVRQTIPAKAGVMALTYPKWIPGEHQPTGPINNMVNLHIRAGDRELAWARDDENMFVFRFAVPPGANVVTVTFDDLEPTGGTMTANLARIKWNRLTLSPVGVKTDAFPVQAEIKLPEGWKWGTALPVDKEDGANIRFKPVTFTALVDSPMIIGRYFRTIDLGVADGKPHFACLAGETPEAMAMKPETEAAMKRLIAEAGLLFGVRHYNSYRWLLTFSDLGGNEGLEHHESSEDGVGASDLRGGAKLDDFGNLICHEYTHSWNGKYRRPTGLATPDFLAPMHGDLLWVYEGLTQYLGTVLPARSGLSSPETFRDAVAATYASLNAEPGRRWRPLIDTAVSVQLTYSAPKQGRSSRRAAEYYDEGLLIWLEADTLIRQQSGGKKSLDDFCRLFHGGPASQPSGPRLVPYDLKDVIAALNTVQPSNWAEFFTRRVYSVQPVAPIEGIENSGWKLVYNDTPSAGTDSYEDAFGYADFQASLGLNLDGGGRVTDIVEGSPASRAGIASNVQIVAVNSVKYTKYGLRDAVRAAKDGKPVELLLERDGTYRTVRLDYTGGLRYPHLERDSAKPDLLSAIIAPKAAPAPPK